VAGDFFGRWIDDAQLTPGAGATQAPLMKNFLKSYM